MVVALGVGLPTEAHAQSSGFNGTQATTYTLTTGANTQTFTFGPNTVIGPTGLHMPGVTGDSITPWNIINQGQINGGFGGGFDQGIFLTPQGATPSPIPAPFRASALAPAAPSPTWRPGPSRAMASPLRM